MEEEKKGGKKKENPSCSERGFSCLLGIKLLLSGLPDSSECCEMRRRGGVGAAGAAAPAPAAALTPPPAAQPGQGARRELCCSKAAQLCLSQSGCSELGKVLEFCPQCIPQGYSDHETGNASPSCANGAGKLEHLLETWGKF